MRKIESLWITWDENEESLCVYADSGELPYVFMAKGFDTVKECMEFAECIAKGFGVPMDEIMRDVSDVENQEESKK